MSLLLWCSLLLCRVARADGVTHVAFSETFDVNTGKGGRDGVYSGSNVTSGDVAYVQEGWTGNKSNNNVYGSYQCLRFGKSNGNGTCTTPEIILIGATKTATLTYNAAGWGDSNSNTLTDACTFWPNTTEEAVMTVTVVPADGTETRLAISADANARVLHGYNNKVYLRDNSGTICFDFGTTAVFNPAPVHNQHVAGWIVGRKQTENGLPKLVATGNTTTDYLAMAAPVTEAATEPAAINADADGHFALSGNVGDWVSVSGGRIAVSSMVSNQFGIQDYTEVYDGALVDVSAIVTANNQLAPVTYDGITYSVEWDNAKIANRWTCYQLHAGNTLAETGRHDDFKADEEVDVEATVDLDFWNLTKKN